MDSKTYTDWIAKLNRASDDFAANYSRTHGNHVGALETWYGSAQYQELKRQEPGSIR